MFHRVHNEKGRDSDTISRLDVLCCLVYSAAENATEARTTTTPPPSALRFPTNPSELRVRNDPVSPVAVSIVRHWTKEMDVETGLGVVAGEVEMGRGRKEMGTGIGIRQRRSLPNKATVVDGLRWWRQFVCAIC
ncbi:hypothetical protein F3Y22_tig00018213pilonHSYRG00002 [Hibiscus syriacus]|uniref:Uncharacterized protein n=1 Tax=Hibiscus syriacus TaxID=106335 RepID=A0A6A3BV68_HIBSY|nr:hypothetical protein F3Y22_tig00018213pilonHSYRG00002 [Hibiscus syriacus]